MGLIAIAAYRPKPGCDEALMELVRGHLGPLRAEGLATDREPIVMRASDGTIVEVFEWRSAEAIAAAHTNPVVGELWGKFTEVCEFVSPGSLPEFQNLFVELASV